MSTTNRLTHKVCILLEDEARALEHAGVATSCDQHRHRHLQRNRAEALVKQGVAQWIGGGRNKIQVLSARTWRRVDSVGLRARERTCVLQYVARGAAY